MIWSQTRWPKMDFYSYGRCSRNENGHLEVNAEFQQTTWQWLFCRPATKRAWYFAGGRWFDKDTGKTATNDDRKIISFIQLALDRTEP